MDSLDSSDSLRLPLWVLGLVVFLVPIAVFLPSASVDFVLDDQAQVTENAAVRELDPGKIFGQGYWANVSESGRNFGRGGDLYRPLTTLSIAFSYQLFETAPRGYHLENILYHALTALLVLALLLRWGFAPLAAFFIALLFGVAPIHIEAVASVILRNELLAAIFSVVFLLCLTSQKRFYLWICAPLSLLAALLAKESSIALPFLALLADWVFVRPAHGWKNRLAVYGLMALACGGYLGLRGLALGQLVLTDPEIVYFGEKSTVIVWLTMARFGIERYLSGALFGAPLVFDYSPKSFPDASPVDPWAWICLAFWVLLAVSALVFAIKRRSPWSFGVLFFFFAIGPTANLITRIGVLGSTRLMYLPYLGIAIAATLAGAALARRLAPRKTTPVLVAAGLATLFALTVQTESRLRPWRDPYYLYADIVANAPENTMARINLANREVEFALELRSPPEDHPPRSRREWVEGAFDNYAAGLRAYPRHYQFVVTNLLYTALHTHREEDLVALFDAGVRSAYPQAQVKDLPQGVWRDHAPLTEADHARLVAWAESLGFLAQHPSEDRVVYHVSRALPDFLRYKSYARAVRVAHRQGNTAEVSVLVQESAGALTGARNKITELGNSGDRILVTAAQSLQRNLQFSQKQIRDPSIEREP